MLGSRLRALDVELRQGRSAEARRRYQRILKRNPRLTPALHFLGVLKHMDGNSEPGLLLLRQAFAQSRGLRHPQ